MVFAPSSMGRPTTPSLPMTPTSTVEPFSMGNTTEARPSSRKYAYLLLPSSSSSLTFRVTGDRYGLRRLISALGREANTRFLNSRVGGDMAVLLSRAGGSEEPAPGCAKEPPDLGAGRDAYEDVY